MTLTLNPRIKVRNSDIEGKGLFAKVPFSKGEKFKVVEGEQLSVIMTDEEFEAHKKKVASWDAVYLGNGKHRVGVVSREEDPSNYGNHSCDPNIAPDGESSIALRDISKGEEITVDYAQFSPKGWEMKCNCGAKICRGIVKGKL